jgi:hypothetical protein
MRYLRKFNESVDDKFSDDFINTIKDICLDLTDIYYKITVRNSTYSLMSGPEQAFNTLRPGDKVIVDSLKIDVSTNSDEVGFDSDILRSTLERVKSFSSEFNFLVDVYVGVDDYADDEFISADDAMSLCKDDARFPMSDYTDITIIIY